MTDIVEKKVTAWREAVNGQSTFSAELPPDYEPNSWTVLCGRGSQNQKWIGNRRFRILLDLAFPRYINSKSKMEKTIAVMSVVDAIRENSGGICGFVKRDSRTNKWCCVSENAAREKVGQNFRSLAAQTKITGRLPRTEAEAIAESFTSGGQKQDPDEKNKANESEPSDPKTKSPTPDIESIGTAPRAAIPTESKQRAPVVRFALNQLVPSPGNQVLPRVIHNRVAMPRPSGNAVLMRINSNRIAISRHVFQNQPRARVAVASQATAHQDTTLPSSGSKSCAVYSRPIVHSRSEISTGARSPVPAQTVSSSPDVTSSCPSLKRCEPDEVQSLSKNNRAEYKNKTTPRSSLKRRKSFEPEKVESSSKKTRIEHEDESLEIAQLILSLKRGVYDSGTNHGTDHNNQYTDNVHDSGGGNETRGPREDTGDDSEDSTVGDDFRTSDSVPQHAAATLNIAFQNHGFLPETAIRALSRERWLAAYQAHRYLANAQIPS